MRTRAYRRQKRKVKIKQRKEMAVAIGGHGEPGRVHSGKHFEKLEAAVNGEKPGILAKHDYGMITRGVSKKTKIKNGQASYRHKGAYGPEKVYTRHDQREMDRILE